MEAIFCLLEKGRTRDVPIVCKELDDVAKRLSADNSSVIEFYGFCVHFFDRVFGDDTTDRTLPTKDQKNSWIPIKNGGWLRDVIQTCDNSLSSVDVRRFLSRRDRLVLSPEAHGLVYVLSFQSNVMDVLRRNREKFSMSIKLLPRRVQMLVFGSPNYLFVKSSEESHNFLRNWCSRVIQTSPTGGSMTLSPFQYFLICLLRYPTMDDGILNPALTSFQRSQQQFNMGPKPSHMPISFMQTCPYSVLLLQNLHSLLPHDTSSTISSSLSPDGWLLLVLAAEYWIGSALVVRRNHAEFKQSKQHVIGRGGQRSLIPNGHLQSIDPAELLLADDHPPAWTRGTMQVSSLFLNQFFDICVDCYF